jgi:hypothetical protein
MFSTFQFPLPGKHGWNNPRSIRDHERLERRILWKCAYYRTRSSDPPGNVLLDVRSGVFCIQGKGSDTNYHERVGHVNWTFKADPKVGRNGHDLYIVAEKYRSTGLNWVPIIGDVIKAIGVVWQVKEAVIP